MTAVPAQFAQFAQSANTTLESSLQATHVALASAERFATLNIAATRGFVDQIVGNTRSLLAAQSPSEIRSLHDSFAQPAVDKVSGYARELYAILTDTHQQFSKLGEKRLAEVNKDVVTLLEANASATGDGEGRSAVARVRKAA